MKKPRPVNLNLLTIKFPIPAIVSILHRISGVVLFLFIPFLLWGFSQSLDSQERFYALQAFLNAPLAKLIAWTFLSALLYHLIAGIRHLLLDMHIGETLSGGRLTGKTVLILAVVLAVLAGVWLW